MQTIIAGRFEQQSDTEHAVRSLADAGFLQDHITSFYLNPPGRHDTYPIGGDEDISPGAEQTPGGIAAGTAAGGAVGAAVGAATVPVTGPLGPVVGAFVGAHIGNTAAGIGSMHHSDPDDAPHERHWGMMVAVGVENEDQANQAEQMLRSLGAEDIERATGTIEDGDWVDFNPTSSPHYTESGMHRGV